MWFGIDVFLFYFFEIKFGIKNGNLWIFLLVIIMLKIKIFSKDDLSLHFTFMKISH